ncbi:MAG: Gfo/Idh/MocA family oxidoreductase [Victivallaceae bacterium]|nr:Gfo/Idh/MocA family oxidoreductase [Victivallaceae bacterium]
MDKIKVGIIGVGALGRHHARLYKESEAAEVVGVFDVQKDNADKVGAEFGIPVFDTWKELAEKCEALSVAVPATYHASTTIPLLEMGKHILSEKPLASDLDGAKKMLEAAKKSNVVLAVGHVERFNPAMTYVEKSIKNERILHVEAKRLAPYPPPRQGMPRRGTEVSVILDLMIHDLDLVLSLMKSEVVKMDVIGAPVLSQSEDVASVRLHFANGGTADISASRISRHPERTLKIYTDSNIYHLDCVKAMVSVETCKINEMTGNDIALEKRNALADELDDFLRAVSETKATGKVAPAKVTGEDGFKALELAVAIEKEARIYCKNRNIDCTKFLLQ